MLLTDLKLRATKCPCGHPGCSSYIVEPLFHCQCSSLRKEEAEELVKRWNGYVEPKPFVRGQADEGEFGNGH